MSGTAETQNGITEKMCWKCGEHFPAELDVCPDDGARLLAVSPDDLADPLIGTLFDGRFRVYRKLGEGGMGNVYSARQVDFERDVALKILKADFLRDENIRKRFMYEARTISNLRHPNALRLFDFGQAPDGSFYMVMELLEGESLADRLSYAFVSFRDVFNIVPPICGVLFEAHENRVIHRDLKPENIYLVDVNKRDEFPKLLDFGIAKHLQDQTMTRSGTLWGTPAYMSPEQARGDTVGGPADIYAIGIILFELISGNLPFSSETQMGLAMKHINVGARPLRSIPGLADVVPEELDELVMSCLDKDPEERPTHAEEVAERLNKIKAAHFDDAKLDIIPAEEVDAIALQDWIAAEPDVSDEAAIPGFASNPWRTPTGGSPVMPTAEHYAAASSSGNVPTFGGSPQDPTRSPHLTNDELEAVSEKSSVGLIVAVVAVLLVGGVVGAVLSSSPASDAEPTQAQPTPSRPLKAMEESATGTAGAAAVGAANVVLTARAVSAALSKPDELAQELNAQPAKAVSAPSDTEKLEEAKPAIERTF